MGIVSSLILGVMIGVVFGFALERSRVVDPEVIIGQFQFKTWIMLKVFLTAIATGLVVFALFFSLGFDRLSWKVTIFGSDLIGGALLGIGIALAGACPGTLFAQIGVGYRDAWVTLCGAIVGALTYAQVKPVLGHWIPWQFPMQKWTLDGLLGLPFWLVALVLCGSIVSILILLERADPGE